MSQAVGNTWAIVFIALALTACGKRESSAVPSAETGRTSDSAVRIERIQPDTLLVSDDHPASLTIRGAGFDATDNTVRLGPITLTAVRSAERGTAITLQVPSRVPSGGGAPPMLWMPGTYTLTVENARGRSNAVAVVVTEPQ